MISLQKSALRLRTLQRFASVKAEEPAVAVSNVKYSKKRFSASTAAAVASVSLAAGFAAGRYSTDPNNNNEAQKAAALPDGLPRTCCESAHGDDTNGDTNGDKSSTPRPLTEAQFHLPSKISRLVGSENVIDGSTLDTGTGKYLVGARMGQGNALCIVTPHKLHHVVDVVEACVQADCVVLVQGSNTGLTGGSVPHTQYDTRPVVLISMKHLDAIFPLDDGKRVVCLAGVGLASLEQFLATNFPDRESHSVLGSTFLNPTVAAGVALGSGGTQCRKGPAYTERALYLKISTNKWNEKIVTVVNTLGIEGMQERTLPPGRARKQMDSAAYRIDTWGRWIKEGYERDMKYSVDGVNENASDITYAERLCRRHSKSVSRYNADTRGPDLCRSEGKTIILATVHDTFPKPKSTKTFWIGFDSLRTALDFRREVCLDNPADLPVSVEYMDRDAFDVVDQSGRVLGSAIKMVGTSSPLLRRLWNIKLWIESLPLAGAPQIVDQILHKVNQVIPPILPGEIMKIGKSLDHHAALTVGDFGDGNTERFIERLRKFVEKKGVNNILIHECKSPQEARALTAFRFVAAPAFRTWCIGEGMQGYSIDYALPKNGGDTPPLAPAGITETKPIKRMRYSHFGCNVVHEDLAYTRDVDMQEAKSTLKKVIELESGGKLPAEHGHGTEYRAPRDAQNRWMKMDPLNVLNPGVGGLSEKFRYEE